jgi:hypothetical protein
MNHLFRIILVLCLAAMAVAALIISNNRANPRSAHELAVEEYVAYRRSTTASRLMIEQYVEARLPQNFGPDMSQRSFSDAAYYAVDQSYRSSPVTLTRPSSITLTSISTMTQMESGGSGGTPLPYPPNDLWCAQLSSSDSAAPQVVLAGLHQDIYNAEWVVHEVTDPATVLRSVGCQFTTR